MRDFVGCICQLWPSDPTTAKFDFQAYVVSFRVLVCYSLYTLTAIVFLVVVGVRDGKDLGPV